MARDESPGNPFAIPGAPAPSAGWHHVNGCRLYAEVRGSGPPLLIIGAASDDAEMFRAIAERLAGAPVATGSAESTGVAESTGAGFTVVTWDRRGTGRSSRDGWPCDSRTHADDAAALLNDLGLAPAAIFGASAGGIVAVRLALRHPELVRQVLAYEPGFFRSTDAGTALLASVTLAVNEYLRHHADDWAGSVAVLARMAAQDQAANKDASDTDGSGTDGSRGPLDAPPGLEWYAERGAALAENFIRDDLPCTWETIDPAVLRASGTDIRFAFGTGSSQVFREIAETLTRARQRTGTPDTAAPGSRYSPGADPDRPDAITGAAHLVYLTPGPIVDYVRARCRPEPPVDQLASRTPKGPVK